MNPSAIRTVSCSLGQDAPRTRSRGFPSGVRSSPESGPLTPRAPVAAAIASKHAAPTIGFMASYIRKDWTLLNQRLDNRRMNDFMIIGVHLMISRHSFPIVDVIDQ